MATTAVIMVRTNRMALGGTNCSYAKKYSAVPPSRQCRGQLPTPVPRECAGRYLSVDTPKPLSTPVSRLAQSSHPPSAPMHHGQPHGHTKGVSGWRRFNHDTQRGLVGTKY